MAGMLIDNMIFDVMTCNGILRSILTLMPWKRESARRGRKARRVLMVLNA